MQDTVECDLSLNLDKIDNSTVYHVKPDIKVLSNIISNFDTVNSNISTFTKHDQNMSINMDQDKIKQENTSQSSSACGVKEEIMYCQSCSYSDIDFDRLKFHIFREHPTGAAVVANSFDIKDCYLFDINLFCVKETCSFSTAHCNVYEEHLMSCCLLHETLSKDEKQRLKSTVRFIIDLKNKHSVNTVPRFLDYFSTLNTTCTWKDVKNQIDKDVEDSISPMLSVPASVLDVSVSCANSGTKFDDSFSSFPTPVLLLTTQNTDFNRTVCKTENTLLSEGELERKPEPLSKPDPRNVTFASSSEGETVLNQLDGDVSENIALEIDMAGSLSDIQFLTEQTKGNKIRELKMYTADCYTKDLHISNQQSACVTRMPTETHPIDHTSDLYDDEMKKERDHFSIDIKKDSCDIHCDMNVESSKQSFKISRDIEQCGYSMDSIQHEIYYTRDKPFPCNGREMKFAQSSILIKNSRSHTEIKQFRCIDCGKTFGRKSHLTEHRRAHTGEKPFKCNDCGKSFSRNSLLKKHSRTHLEEKSFKCNECGKTFRRNRDLIGHIRIHTGKKPFKCNECGKTFGQKSDFIKHSRTHTGEKPFKCNDCGKTFSQNSHLIVHMRTHTGEKPFKCNECGRTFGQNSDLIKHKRTHTGEKPFKCNECGKTFGHNCSLFKHRRTHTGEKQLTYDGCEKTFGHRSSLIKHRKIPIEEKPFKCNDCGKTFSKNRHLSEHRRTHTGEKPFKCNDCGKIFGQNSHLIEHRRTHTGEKPFLCKDCGKTFSQNSHLTVHMRTHTGEKPFKCNMCGKTFAHNSGLSKHRRTHTGEKPYKCNDCEKTFRQNSHLIVHMRTHTVEKSFKCNECGKTFGQDSSFVKHMRTHSKEKLLKCNECGKTMVSIVTLLNT